MSTVPQYNRLTSQSVDSLINQGAALHKSGDLDQARSISEQAIRLDPTLPHAHNNLGNILKDLRLYPEAQAAYSRAIALNPTFPEFHNNLGALLRDMGQPAQSLPHLLKAIDLHPHYFEAYYNLGIALQDMGRLVEAQQAYLKALDINPQLTPAIAQMCMILHYLCDWDQLTRYQRRLDKLTDSQLRLGHKTSEAPFYSMTHSDNPHRNLAVARSWSQDLAKKMAGLHLAFSYPRPSSNSPLRLGYISYDFFHHPVAQLIQDLFVCHNRQKFQVFAYTYGPDDHSPTRSRLQTTADQFHDISHLSSAAAARLINDHHIDILIDLKGHTQFNRLEIMALRPAPLQVAWLGFPGTSGASFIDYIIADAIVLPPNHYQYYSEQPIILPHTYQINPRYQPPAPPPTRAQVGLPTTGFVFASFNHPYKIEPRVFSVWLKLLPIILFPWLN